MERKGFISEFMNGGRILSKGKIDSLCNGFSLPNEIPFSIYVRPKHPTSAIDVVLDVTCYQEDNSSEAPVVLNDWTPLAIVKIAANAELLEQYDVYWGSGDYIYYE